MHIVRCRLPVDGMLPLRHTSGKRQVLLLLCLLATHAHETHSADTSVTFGRGTAHHDHHVVFICIGLFQLEQ